MRPTKLHLILILGVAILFLGGFLYIQKPRSYPIPKPKQLTFEQLERADQPEEHRRGLMGRSDLCANCGMLFIFNEQSTRTFWMKNTPKSLDMIFIRADGTIAEIHENTLPNSETPYSSRVPVKYVLEVPAGYTVHLGLQESQQLDIQNLINQAK